MSKRLKAKGRRVDGSVFLLESFRVAWTPPPLVIITTSLGLAPFMSRTSDLNSKQDRMICYLPQPLLDSTWSILFSNSTGVTVAEGAGENATSTCALSTSSIIRAKFSPVNTWPRRSSHLDFGPAHLGFWHDLGQRKDLACVH